MNGWMDRWMDKHWKTSFSVLASKCEYGFDLQGLIWHLFHL